MRKCINNCNDDTIYKFEYNNTCYKECPDGTYYNYEYTKCIDNIPDGYYCNDTTQRTIDKCHDNCKTCNKSATTDNNNCLTCKDSGPIYFDLGNCTDECINGHFTENSIEKCKCSSNISCEYCSEESKQYNLCVSCNTGYYPKINDDINKFSFINCYNNITISEGYYLNETSQLYEPCYSSCKKCIELGNDDYNK